jgi:hypothetical protein
MMRISKFSIRIKLDDFIENKVLERLIVDKLINDVDYICRGNVKVVFYNQNISQKRIKEFINRHSKLFSTYVVEFTKEFKNTWFLINTDGDDISKWRYMTKDNILNGIDSYINLVKHIQKKG